MTRTSCLWTAKCIFLNIHLRRKAILSIFVRIFFHYPTKNNRSWITFKTLAEIERDCNERQLNSA